MNSISDKSKIRLFDDMERKQRELREAPYQIFTVNEDGRWIPTLARNCAPNLWEDEQMNLVAIIDGKPHDVTLNQTGTSMNYFPGGDDGTVITYFDLIANGVIVGSCSFEEY